MPAKTFAENFVPAITTCEEIQNAGSILKVAPLINCASEPTIYELTPSAAAAANAESISLFISSPVVPATPPAGYVPPRVRLAKGTVLYFGAAFNLLAVVANDVLVNGTTAATAVAVPVDPLAAPIAVTDRARTWGLQTLLSPTDLPLTDNDSTVDRTDLTYGLQGATVKTTKEKSSAVAIIARTDDRAFWEVIYPASQGAQNIFAHFIKSGGVRAWGPAKIMSLTQPGAIREISRPTFTLSFQSPFAAPTLRQYITDTVQLNTFDTVMRLSGV